MSETGDGGYEAIDTSRFTAEGENPVVQWWPAGPKRKRTNESRPRILVHYYSNEFKSRPESMLRRQSWRRAAGCASCRYELRAPVTHRAIGPA